MPKSKPKLIRVVFVDDEEVNRKQWLELAAWRPDIHATAVEDILRADKIPADFYVIDVSAVAFLTQWSHAYAPICSLVQNHPGATFVIMSAMSRNSTEEIIEDVFKATGVQPVYGGIGEWEPVNALIKL